MEDSSTECFDYILKLSKQLSDIQEGRRRETDNIEQLLKKITRQSYIDYEEFSSRTINHSNNNNPNYLTTEEGIINENYQLLYQIRKQEFIKKKVIQLIDQYKELILSIKYLIIEQDALKPRIEKDFVTDKVLPQSKQLRELEKTFVLETDNIKKNKEKYRPVLVQIIKQLHKLNVEEINDYLEQQNLLSFV